jgi:hypothetical protein
MEEEEENKETAKIITFPREKKPTPPASEEEKIVIHFKDLKETKEALVGDYMRLLVPMIFTTINNLGFNPSSLTNAKDSALIIESIKSYFQHRLNIPNKLQIIAEKLFEIDEHGNIKTADVGVFTRKKPEKKEVI